MHAVVFWLFLSLFFFPQQATAYGLDPTLPLRLDVVLLEQKAQHLIAATLTPEPGYYYYAQNSEAGRPTRLGLFSGSQPLESPVRYPIPQPQRDVFSGKIVDAYAGELSIFLDVPPDADPTDLHLGVSLLLCSQQHCIPVDAAILLSNLPPGEWTDVLRQGWQASLPGKPLAALPRNASPPAETAPTLPFGQLALTLSASTDVLPLSPLGTAPHSWEFTPRLDDPATEPASLGMALFWGLLAGLILNIMPCVLPVLALKMSALLHIAEPDERDERDEPDKLGRTTLRTFREHNLFFALGALVWFSLLALTVSLLGLTWGGLFQHPPIVAGLTILVCLLGLSMLGLCTLPIIDLKAGISGSPRSQAFFTGMTATLLATPCSGPLLGGVLAWSAMQSPLITFLVFFSMGLGMSIPYIVFAIWPGTVRFLPRPGNWLHVLERVIGIFLLGTSLYLLLILPQNWSLGLTAALTLLACALAWRKTRRPSRLMPSILAGGLTLWLILPASSLLSRESRLWESFTTETFFAALGHELILVQFTADWCPNCKALEMTTLNPARLRDWQQRHKVRLFKLDMTLPGPDQERLLRALNSISIPLTALFPAGDQARSPVILRDVYTPSRLEAALSATAKESQ